MKFFLKIFLIYNLFYVPLSLAQNITQTQESLLNKACQDEKVIKAHIADKEVHLALACTDSQQEYGLMFRNALPENDGMIFVFKKNQFLHFWMKDTLIPLSIAYIDEDFIIKEIYNMKAEDLTVINSGQPLRYAIEMNVNWYEKNKVHPGEKLLIDIQ